jgi:hypothetical protein
MHEDQRRLVLGLVKARAAVSLAESWCLMKGVQTSANEASTFQDALDSTMLIPNGSAAGTTFNITEADSINVERLARTVLFSTTHVGDFRIDLTAADDTANQLLRDVMQGQVESRNALAGAYTFQSQAFRGSSSADAWSVRLVDATGRLVLAVSHVQLNADSVRVPFWCERRESSVVVAIEGGDGASLQPGSAQSGHQRGAVRTCRRGRRRPGSGSTLQPRSSGCGARVGTASGPRAVRDGLGARNSVRTASSCSVRAPRARTALLPRCRRACAMSVA